MHTLPTLGTYEIGSQSGAMAAFCGAGSDWVRTRLR